MRHSVTTLLIRNHWYVLRHGLRLVREQSFLKSCFIASFSVGWLVSLSLIFYSGFRFLNELGSGGFFLVPRLFSLFFLGLGVMLVLSGAITGYATLFQSTEIRRLICWPIPMSDLLRYCFIKVTLMSSWAFFFIIVPFIGAYGVLKGWPIAMILWASLYSVPFVMLFAGAGIFLVLFIVRFIPRGAVMRKLGILLLLLATMWAIHYSNQVAEADRNNLMVLIRLVPGLNLASNPLVPSAWMAEGILSLSQGEIRRGGMYFALLASSVPVLGILLATVGARWFTEAFQRNFASQRPMSTEASKFSRFLHGFAPWAGGMRSFAIKDILNFVRDPSQWTQSLIFFGLLGIYFLNLRSMGYHRSAPVWNNMIAFLNLFSLCAVMSSLSSRFVYPQMSLEGKTLWVVGLAPMSMVRLMWSKFLIAFVGLVVVGGGLTLLSNGMLTLPFTSQVITWMMVPCMAFSLAGLASGLGGSYMSTRPSTPSEILNGYGGTLNLILSLICVMVMVLPPAIASHTLISRPDVISTASLIAIAGVYLAAVAMMFGGLPLMIGARSLSNRDY